MSGPDDPTLRLRQLTPGGAHVRDVELRVQHLVLGGYTARDAAERQRHIDELRQIGIEAPDRVPAFWAMAPRLATTADRIEVQGATTSGEIEYALLFTEDGVLVAAASDQTDRAFEVHSIPRSKQLCAKVLSEQVVALDDLRPAWDDIVVFSEVSEDRTDDGAWIPYQRAPLAVMMHPDELVAACFDGAEVPTGTVVLSGTVSLVDGVTRHLPWFRGGLELPGGRVSLDLGYEVAVLPEYGSGDAS